MAHRHDVQRAKGGRVVYAGGESNVVKEAREHKHGGKVHHRATGGKVVGRAFGGRAVARLDKRARGGRVGADKSPFSSAATGKDDHGRTSHTIPTPGPR